MKKTTVASISNVSMVDDDLDFDVLFKGSLKDQEVGSTWNVDKINLTVHVRAKATDVLAGFGANEWIGIQGQLRKCPHDFVASLKGQSYSMVGLEAMIAANVPSTDKTGLKVKLSAAEERIANMTAMLKEMGLSDEQIEAKLAAL